MEDAQTEQAMQIAEQVVNEERAKEIRHWRVELGLTWREVSGRAYRDWMGARYRAWSDQWSPRIGRALCRQAGKVLGQGFT